MVLITPVTPPEHLLYTANNIRLKLGNKIIGQGTIYISQNSLSWQPTNLPEGICIDWKQVSLHGISLNPTKCIYFMLDHQVMWEGVYMDEPGSLLENNHDVEIDNSFEFAIMEQPVTECWLLPDDIDIHSVDTMYRVMTTCQTLHPDSEDTNSDESEDEFAIGGIIHEDQEAGNSDENGRAESCVMGGMMQELNLEDERFEDAEE